MSNGSNNAVPIFMAVLLHIVLLASMLAAFDFARPTPITPLAIQATLVSDAPAISRLPLIEEEPEPEPEPEPLPEPEPEPDNSAELQRQAEEEKRQQDALIEKERLEKIRRKKLQDQERKERKAVERKRREDREEAERKKREEEDKEKKRIEAERKREQDIQRQRDENERARRELEAEYRVQEIEDEENRFSANNSPEMAAYQFAIAQKIRRNWSVPASASSDTLCVASVRQLAGGEIVGVSILSCNGDEAVKRSVEAAIRRSSPLPEPPDPALFRPLLELNLRPEQQ